MSLTLSRRDRRVLALGAGAVSLLLLFAKGLPAWRRWDAAERASAAELVGDEAAARAEVRGLAATVDSAEARRARVARLAPALLDGESPASAGATLAAILTGAAARSGVRLGSVQVTPDTASASTFTRVAVRADATGDLQGITEMLQYLESTPELLAVRELAITQPDAGGANDRPESLQMEITVLGLALVHPPAPDTASSADGSPSIDPDSIARDTTRSTEIPASPRSPSPESRTAGDGRGGGR
jgi:hypothetical protein